VERGLPVNFQQHHVIVARVVVKVPAFLALIHKGATLVPSSTQLLNFGQDAAKKRVER
jgi:hypothetical protein